MLYSNHLLYKHIYHYILHNVFCNNRTHFDLLAKNFSTHLDQSLVPEHFLHDTV